MQWYFPLRSNRCLLCHFFLIFHALFCKNYLFNRKHFVSLGFVLWDICPCYLQGSIRKTSTLWCKLADAKSLRALNHASRSSCNFTAVVLRKISFAILAPVVNCLSNDATDSSASQRFRLHLPCCGRGFKSQAHHLYFFNLYFWNCNEKSTKINKKRPGLAHFLTFT